MEYAVTQQRRTSADQQRHRVLRRLAPFVGDVLFHTGLTASVACLRGGQVLFAHRVHGHGGVWTPSDDSGLGSAHRTAAGRVLLSYEPADAVRLSVPAEAMAVHGEIERARRCRLAVVEHGELTCVAVGLPDGGTPIPAVFTVKGRRVDVQRTVFLLRQVVAVAAESFTVDTHHDSPA